MAKVKLGKKKVATEDVELIEEANKAVAHYAELRQELEQMQEQFEEQFPEANAFLEEIHSQKDTVEEAIGAAKIKVALAKTTVGPFECSRAFRQAGYDDEKLSDILLAMDNRTEVFEQLVLEGVIKGVKVDREKSAAFAATHPKTAAPFMPAWEDRAELTPRVKTPKL